MSYVVFNYWFEEVVRGYNGRAPSANVLEDTTVNFENYFSVGDDLSDYVVEIDGFRYRASKVLSSTQIQLEDDCLDTKWSNKTWYLKRAVSPPDTLWAEITHLDNRQAIENNFGRLVGFTLDDLNARTDDLDYLSAVQGLWYYVLNGRTLYNTRLSAQIILGLPFAINSGEIVDVQVPFDTTRNRILIREDSGVVRSYTFPKELDVETNPETGETYKLGDRIERFAPLCTGVEVTDYVKDPTWIEPYVGAGILNEVQKVHTYGVIVSADVFNLDNLVFLSGYLKKYRPIHTDVLFVVVSERTQTVDIDSVSLIGPVVPEGYTFPTGWPAYPVPVGWADSPWELERSVSPNIPELPVDFGGLRLVDVPGNVADGWSGPNHTPTKCEGAFMIGDTDESGNYIHKIDEHKDAVNLLQDGTMEQPDNPGTGSSPWSLVGSPATAVKDSAFSLSGTRSLHISDVYGSVGVEQSISVQLDEDSQIAASLWIYVVSGQAHIRLLDQNNPQTVLAEWRMIEPRNEWHRINLHAWSVSQFDTNYVTLQILTGPAGGDFWVDAAGTEDYNQVGIFNKLLPWEMWGVGKSIMGRTGNYTDGGLPDENMEMLLGYYSSGGPPVINGFFPIDAASIDDEERLAGPSVDTPPSDWNTNAETPWHPTNRGYTVDEWKDTTGYAGYGTASTPTTSWIIGVNLPTGWYTRVTKAKTFSGKQ